MNAPHVAAVVQVRVANSGEWWAAIVTRVVSGELVDLAIFPPNGGVRPARLVGHLPAHVEESDERYREIYVWRWAEERTGR